MKIISLAKKNNDVKLTLDDGSNILIDYRTFIDFRIHKDYELDDEKLKLLSIESSFVKCKDSAFRILARRINSKKELKIKLLKKKYPVGIVEKVINELEEKKYLNDESFAEQFAKEKVKKNKFGISKIESELIKKGIDKKIIQKVISKIDDNYYNENINTLITKKLKILKEKTSDKMKLKSKIISHLLSKGYEYEKITDALKRFDLERED